MFTWRRRNRSSSPWTCARTRGAAWSARVARVPARAPHIGRSSHRCRSGSYLEQQSMRWGSLHTHVYWFYTQELLNNISIRRTAVYEVGSTRTWCWCVIQRMKMSRIKSWDILDHVCDEENYNIAGLMVEPSRSWGDYWLLNLTVQHPADNACFSLDSFFPVADSPESLSVRVNTKEVVSRAAMCPGARRGPTDTQPSGWQKYTMSRGSGKSSWLVKGYRRSSSGA